jgi:A/G-specific adenine glycosylase
LTPEEFSTRLARWHERHGRTDLPWQNDPSPYRVWVSEVMLQQTQVATVIPYYQRFMGQFPSVRALSEAPLDEVLRLWSGLGYYARARHLHRAAQMVCEKHGGSMPVDFDALRSLPGIGRSTAGAILALSAGLPFPILDGNVKRVLTRFYGIDGWPGEPGVEKELWRLAERYTPARAPNVYAQAMMDLGATLCTRTRPDCQHCPVAEDCTAYREGRQTSYPQPRPRKALPLRTTTVLVLEDEIGAVLLERRPPAGLWGGLWSFPECASPMQIDAWSERHLGQLISGTRCWPAIRHTFSHFHLDIRPLHARVRRCADRIMEDAGRVWYKVGQPQPFGITAIVKRLLPMLDGVSGRNGI